MRDRASKSRNPHQQSLQLVRSYAQDRRSIPGTGVIIGPTTFREQRAGVVADTSERSFRATSAFCLEGATNAAAPPVAPADSVALGARQEIDSLAHNIDT